MPEIDEHSLRFMERALALARKGVGLTSPNPTVGCVIVRDGQIVGEGFHQYDLLDHAEIVALKSAGERARGATLYVTLEPCNHTGRTGPCTEAIIAAGVQHVVAAMEDPNPVNAGRGFERLRAANIEVVTGVLGDEGERLNEGFAHWIRTKKPFVTLKSAMTLDGQLALPGQRGHHQSKARLHRHRDWITSEESRAEVQRMRHASDALLTGIGTIRVDDPLLTDRSGLPRRRRLLRVILDSGLNLPYRSRIVQSTDNDLLVITGGISNKDRTRTLNALGRAGAEIVSLRATIGVDLDQVLEELGKREILNVLLEAGPTLNGSALAANVVQKLFLFYAPKIAGEARVPFAFAPKLNLPPLRNLRTHSFGPDVAIEGYIDRAS